MRSDSTKIKLAIVIPNLDKGGAEKVLINFVNNLDYDSYEPVIFCLKKEGDLIASANPQVVIEDLNSPRVYFSIWQIKKYLLKHKPDVLIGWMGHVNAVLAFFKPLLPRSLTLMCRESSIPSKFIRYYRAPGLFRFMYRFLNRYDGIICQSDAMRQDLIDNFKVKKDKIRTINNPVIVPAMDSKLPPETQQFINSTDKVLLFVGRFSPEKRTELLLELISSLPDDYKLLLVGYGQLEQTLRDGVATKNLSSRVQLITNCSNPAAFYRRANCFLLTSSFEGFPNVLLEASMCGCPVVVYQTEGGAREIVNEINGIYISSGPVTSIVQFAQAVSQICNNPEKYNRELISRHTQEKFGVEKIINKYTEYIDSVIKNK